MRNGTVIINGTNIWTTYKTFVSKGGYRGLVQWPALKGIEGNDWQETDGFEPDLSAIHLDTRQLDMNFVCLGTAQEMTDFYNFLCSAPKMTYAFSDISRTLTLRVLSMPSLRSATTLKAISVRFAADIPLEGYTYTAPVSTLPENREYIIDDVLISDYGVRVLKGTVEGVSKCSDVKPLLVRSNRVTDGATYDENGLLYSGGSWSRSNTTGNVTVRSRDIVLKCLIYESTLAAAWKNYDAFLYDLTKINSQAEDPTLAGARRIVIRALGTAFKCYYKSQSVTEFTTDGTDVWIKFDLTLTLFEEEGSVSFF